MRRKISAFIAFNVYFSSFLEAFKSQTPYLFDTKKILELESQGIFSDPTEWGWGGHYIWRLVSICTVTGIAAFLAGAIAKNKGGKVAIISNIPNVLFSAFIFYLATFGDVKIQGQIGYAITSIIAIPLSTLIAYITGSAGELIQQEKYDDSTVLGIRPYHWIWLVLPLHWYVKGLVFVIVKYVAVQIALLRELRIIISTIIWLLSWVPIIAWVYPLVLVYKVLSGKMLKEKSRFIKIMVNTCIFILGALVALGVQYICFRFIGLILE